MATEFAPDMCSADERGVHYICGCGDSAVHCQWCCENLSPEQISKAEGQDELAAYRNDTERRS